MSRLASAAGSLLLALCVAGCPGRSPVVNLAPTGQRHTAADYDSVREHWTRSDRIIKNLDTTLQVYGTLFSFDFIDAYVAKRAQLFRLAETDRRSLESGLAFEARRSYTFFVSASCAEYTWNDFDRKGDSVWRIALSNDRGEQVTASEIKAGRTISATTLELFPYVGSFHRTYELRFPLTLADGRPLVREDTSQLQLLFSGPLGQAQLTWQLR